VLADWIGRYKKLPGDQLQVARASSRRGRSRSTGQPVAAAASDVSTGNAASSRAEPSFRQRQSLIATAIFVFVLVSAPLPFGSRDPLVVAIWCLLLGTGLIFAPSAHLRKGHFLVLCGVAVVAAGYAFVLHEQLSEHPWIAPYNPIWSETSKLIGRPLTPSVSIVRGEPFYALGASLAGGLALVLGVIVGADRSRARQLLAVAAWVGLVYALYAIFAYLFTPTLILWQEKTAYIGDLTGTFINRNTAASYFGLCSAIWFVLLMSAIRNRLPDGRIVWSEMIAKSLSHAPTKIIVRFAGLFICIAATLLTNSRAGVILSLLALIIGFVIYFRRDLPRGKGFALAILIAAAVALGLLQILGSNIGSRIDQLGLADAGRMSVYRSTLHIIAANPWFGTGLGTFSWAFPAYRSDDISTGGVWATAHSTPLELAAEVGIPLALLVAVAWLTAMIVLLRAATGRRRNTAVPLGAFLVCLIALLHSSIDFPLQIVGYSLVVMGMLGVGLGQSFSDDQNVLNGHGWQAIAPTRASMRDRELSDAVSPSRRYTTEWP
jgi:O-Antigen ligase